MNIGIVQCALRKAQTTAASLTDGVLTTTTTTTISPFRLKALAAFEFCLGLLKITLGALLLTTLMPRCPEGCECADFFSFYPYVCFALGVMWIQRSLQLLATAASLDLADHTHAALGQDDDAHVVPMENVSTPPRYEEVVSTESDSLVKGEAN